MRLDTGLTRLFAGAAFSIVVALTSAELAFADSTELRISYQYGLGFFPITVVLEQHLIEKHAKALGLPDVTVSGLQISGAGTSNDALLSGSIDVASGGVGGLLQMWDKTNGKVRGLISVNDMSFLLNTTDPGIKTINDYLTSPNQRIALPAVKIGLHAIVLSIAAEKAFGPDKYDALDTMTISLPHPDALAALKSGQSEIKSHFASLPFSYLERQFKSPAVHTVLSSYDVMGGPHNNTLLYTNEKWQTDNPKLAQAVYDAFTEAEAWIEADPAQAAQLFKTATKSSLELSDIAAILKDKSLTGYSPEPHATMMFAQFLHRTGRIKRMPSGWKDYFWPIAHALNGS